MFNIYYLSFSYLPTPHNYYMGVYCGEINYYDQPLSQLIRFQNKAVRIMNDVPLRNHITPHYVQLVSLKFCDIVKIYNCLFLYDYLSDNKPCNFLLSLKLYLSNIIILNQVHLLSNYTFPTQELIVKSFAQLSLENTIGTIFPFTIRNKSTKILFKKAL